MGAVIRTKKELDFYIMADRMMNRGRFYKSISRRLYELFIPDIMMDYFESMRKLSYYSYPSKINLSSFLYLLKHLYYKRKFIRLGYKLGFSIGPECFGYGLVIHHHGTIIIGGNNRIGNYALVNSSVNFIRNGSEIGDSLFVGAGAKIIKGIKLGHNIYLGANSVLSSSFDGGNLLLAGIPAIIKKQVDGPWWDSLYGGIWKERHDKVEVLKQEMFAPS